MKYITLTQNKKAIVDDSDYQMLSQWKWCYTQVGYAVRRDGNNKCVYMHRQILNVQKGKLTDHINRDKLDNRRENLRICTRAENGMNKVYKSTSGYKGVTWSKAHEKWKAQIGITINGQRKSIYLGQYDDIKEAHQAYIKAADKHFGKFARIGVL
jgi:hypothetical protein